MTDQQMLEQLITRAIDDGYVPVTGDNQDDLSIKWLAREYSNSSDAYDLFSLLFSHDFAKAVFSKKCTWCGDNHSMPKHGTNANYKIGLQKAVISDNPIKTMWEQIQ